MRHLGCWASVALQLLYHLDPASAAVIPRNVNHTGEDTGIIAPKVFIMSMVSDRKKAVAEQMGRLC